MKIHYLTENPSVAYAKAIRSAKTLKELVAVVNKYRRVADDAWKAVNKMDADDFKAFKKDLPKLKTATGKTAEELTKKWGNIVLPFKLLWTTIIAEKLHAPWGTAIIRCEDVGWPEKIRN